MYVKFQDGNLDADKSANVFAIENKVVPIKNVTHGSIHHQKYKDGSFR